MCLLQSVNLSPSEKLKVGIRVKEKLDFSNMPPHPSKKSEVEILGHSEIGLQRCAPTLEN